MIFGTPQTPPGRRAPNPLSASSSGDLTILSGLGRLGPGLLTGMAWSIVADKPRSLAQDTQRIVALMEPPPRVEGLDLVPRRDPFLLVANHFQSPGLWIGWIAAAITAAVVRVRAEESQELHWLVTSEWPWFEIRGVWVANPISSFLFPRACRVWGLIPTPPRPSDVSGRARALRRLLGYLGRRPRDTDRQLQGVSPERAEPAGLFPEGRATISLEEAMPGVGAFLYRVSGLNLPLLPVGVYREDRTLVVRFGRPFSLGEFPGGGEDLDAWARRQVMVAIGRLLPQQLWGVYAADIASSA